MWMNGSAPSNSNGHNHGRPRTGTTSSSTTETGGSASMSAPPRDYPNLAPWCRVVVLNPNLGGAGGGGSARNSSAPVSLPQEVAQYCQSYLSTSSNPSIRFEPYDFALERQVLSDANSRRHEYLDGLRSSQSHDDLKRSVVAKMRGVTSADETVCVSILESHSYDLKTSVEAYFASPNTKSSY